MLPSDDDSLIWRSFLLLLILAPLPSGSISPLAQSFLVAGVLGVFTLSSFRRSPEPGADSDRNHGRLVLLRVLWGIGVGYAIFQAIPIPPGVIESLSSSLFDLYQEVLPHDSMGRWRSISTVPGATLQTGLLIAAYGAAFLLTTRLCLSRERILILAQMIVVVGAAEAIYGLAQMGGSLATAASGSFVNRNHFAALLAMALCVAVGLILARWEARQAEYDMTGGAPEYGVRFDRWALSTPLAVASLLVLTGIVFSFSRTGLTAPIGSLILLGLVWLVGAVSKRARLIVAGTGAVSLLLVGGAWPALDIVAARFQTLDDVYRLAAWEGTYNLFVSSPIVGIGLGGLVDNLPRFLPLPISETFDHGHNELLEILAEGGIPYAGIVLLGLIIYLGAVGQVWRRRRDPLARGLGLGCLAALLAVLAHSLVEFPLRMPANGLYLSVIMGLGWVAVHFQSSTLSSGSASQQRRWSFQRAAPVLASVGIGLSVVAFTAEGLDRVGGSLVERATRLSRDQQGPLLAEAMAFHQRSATLEPWQPAHAFRLGRVYELRAVASPTLSDEGQRDWRSAEQHYREAAELHPANARFQAALAWAALQAGDPEDGHHAAKAAVMLAPTDRDIGFAISRWYLSQWEYLDAEDQDRVTTLVHQGARDFPEPYVDATWEFVRDLQTVRRILPHDLRSRRILVERLTDRRLFLERWEEQEAHSGLRVLPSDKGPLIIDSGQLSGREQARAEALPLGPWTGMVEGWLSSGLTATVECELPPGEVLVYIPVRGEQAGGVWPELNFALGGVSIPVRITGEDWRTAFVLVSSGGGRFLLESRVTNGAVVLENGRFQERRVTLGRVALLVPRPS
jgi:O-antigen ligase